MYVKILSGYVLFQKIFHTTVAYWSKIHKEANCKTTKGIEKEQRYSSKNYFFQLRCTGEKPWSHKEANWKMTKSIENLPKNA